LKIARFCGLVNAAFSQRNFFQNILSFLQTRLKFGAYLSERWALLILSQSCTQDPKYCPYGEIQPNPVTLFAALCQTGFKLLSTISRIATSLVKKGRRLIKR
jgi:hypothetical protein